tara:strand:- start:1206 stop:3089 length:1884 start_codon:yes stop_codon:yes gene_type:complete
MNKKIFFAEYFTISLFIHILFKKNPSIIYLQDSVDSYTDNKNKKNIYEKFINKLFPKIKIIRIPEYKDNIDILNYNSICYITNDQTLEFIESIFFKNKIKEIAKTLFNLIDDDKIIYALKKSFIFPIFQKILFYNLLKEFEKNNIIIDKVFINKNDIFNLRKYLYANTLKINHKIKSNNFLNFINNIIYLSSPYVLRSILKRGISIKSPKQQRYDIGLQVVWGFNHSIYKINTQRNFIDDDELSKSIFLENKKIVYLTGNKFGRSLTKTVIKNETNHVKSIGANIVDESKFKIPIFLFFRDYIINGIIKINANMNSPAKDIIQKIYIEYLDCKLANKYMRIKIIVSRDDYDSSHITRTIAQNKEKLLNFGIQHSAFAKPAQHPLQAYNYFDKYYIQGDGFKELWSPFWNTNKNLFKVGQQRSHLLNEEKLNRDLILRFNEKYKGKKTIMIMISSISSVHTPSWLYKERFNRIEELLDINSNIQIILKPRNKQSIIEFLNLLPHLKPYVNSGKISIEDKEFTLHELISYVDILVTEDSSSTILEAAHRKDLLILAYQIRYPHQPLLENLMMKNFNELFLTISYFIQNKSFPYNYQKIITELREKYSMDKSTSSWDRVAIDLNRTLNSF